MSTRKFKDEVKRIKKDFVIQTEKPSGRQFGPDDLLKHFIRKQYWTKRIDQLQRDFSDELEKGIRYFSLCSKYAFDVRYFLNLKLLDLSQGSKKVGFSFCEVVEEDARFLLNSFIPKRLPMAGTGYVGKLADIATNSKNQNYGRFWGNFPFDVINLDYWGDIFRTNQTEIGINDFYAIKSIIDQQARLRRAYEFWVTMRVKAGRIEGNVKQTFREIIEHNNNTLPKFKKKFKDTFKEIGNIVDLDDEKLFYMGYLKWICYVCKLSFSTINVDKTEILRYTRNDKDGEEYNIYNILLRIEPYETITIPSPVGDAAKYCEDEYKKGIMTSFKNSIDVREKFDRLDSNAKRKIKEEIKKLDKEFQEDSKGFL